MKLFIRKAVFKYNMLFNLYYRYFYKPKDELSHFLNNLSKRKKGKIYFIQIGSNDGHWGDPIYKFIRRDNWSGILIEPQKEVFRRLINNYKDFSDLFFENVAIDSKEGERILYKISFSDSQWASGISSFYKKDIQNLIEDGYIHKMAKLESLDLTLNEKEWIGEEKVKIQTLKNIIEKYQVKQIDLIMVDAEGYDFEIIKTIPFELIKPKVIIYEHSHFNLLTKNECSTFLKKHGYNLVETYSDTIAEQV